MQIINRLTELSLYRRGGSIFEKYLESRYIPTDQILQPPAITYFGYWNILKWPIDIFFLQKSRNFIDPELSSTPNIIETAKLKRAIFKNNQISLDSFKGRLYNRITFIKRRIHANMLDWGKLFQGQLWTEHSRLFPYISETNLSTSFTKFTTWTLLHI